MEILKKYSPYLCILALILSIQINSDLVIDNNDFRTILIAVITSGLCILLAFSQKRLTVTLNQSILTSVLFIILFSISFLWAHVFSLSIVSISKLLVFFILFMLLVSLCNLQANSLKVIVASIPIAFLLSLFSFVQQFWFLDELTYTSVFNLFGISGHKNLYASFVFLTLIGSLIGLHIFRNQRFWCIFILFVIILQGIIIVLLRTRAVWLACMVSVIIFGLLSCLKRIKLGPSKVLLYSLIASVLITAAITFALPVVISKYMAVMEPSKNITKISDTGTIAERMKVWEKTFDMIKENLYSGVGVGNWKIIIPKYSLPDIYKVQDMNVIFQRPHNEYLRILSENGVFGLLLFIFLLTGLVFLLFGDNTPSSYNMSKTIFSGFMGFCTIMFFSFPLERIEHGVIITFILVIINSHQFQITETRNIQLPKISYGMLLFICLSILVVYLSRYKSAYYLKKAYYARQTGNSKKVVALCDSAITMFTKVDDYSIPIYWYRGNAHANMQKYNHALHDFKQAYTFHPYHTHVLNDLGSAYYLNEKPDSAIYFYKKSAMINPRFDEPKLNLVAIYLNKGELKKAKKWEKSILHDSKRREHYRELIIQKERAQ